MRNSNNSNAPNVTTDQQPKEISTLIIEEYIIKLKPTTVIIVVTQLPRKGTCTNMSKGFIKMQQRQLI